MDRRFKYLWDRQVVYRRDPITDKPDIDNNQYMFFKNGTYQAYDLFKSKAKITTYRSLKWHMLALWYLNPDWEREDAEDIARYLTYKPNGFTTFNINKWNLERLINDISKYDLEVPPKNKIRKVIFKMGCGLEKSEKLSIVGTLIGRLNGVKKEDIYSAMLLLNDGDQKITIAKLAKILNVTPRTIHRHMCDELKQVKEELNEEINI